MKRLMFSLISVRQTAAALVVAVLAAGASAGEFFEKNGVAIRGYDPVAYFTDGKPVKGAGVQGRVQRVDVPLQVEGESRHVRSRSGEIRAAVRRVLRLRDRGWLQGRDEPAAFTVVDGKLYLNYNRRSRRSGAVTSPDYVKSADGKWPRCRDRARSSSSARLLFGAG